MPPTSINSKCSDRSSVAEQLHQRGVLVRAPQCYCACKERRGREGKKGERGREGGERERRGMYTAHGLRYNFT